MGRLISILAILATIIGISLGGIFYVADTRDKLFAEIDVALSACEKDNLVVLKEKSKAMSDLMEERHGTLSLFVRHDEIEKLENFLIKLDGYASINNMGDATVTLMETRFMAEHIFLRETLTIDNLF